MGTWRNEVMASMRDEDLNGEEIWCYEEEKELDSGPTLREYSSSSFSAWHLPRTPRMIPRVVSNYSSAKHDETNEMGQKQQSSAPVNIPDWSKIYGTKHGNMNGSSRVDDDDDDDDRVQILPPHEWLSKKLARSQISSFSVCEGLGRTLKGRDSSKCHSSTLPRLENHHIFTFIHQSPP